MTSTLEIKSTPPHNFDVDIKLYTEIDPEYMLGRIDKDGNVIENEIEVLIDGKQALIKLYSCFKKQFQELPALDFIIRLAKGIDGRQLQHALIKKYGSIQPTTEVLIYEYELLELGE